MLRRPLFMLAVGVVLMHAAPACVGGGDDTGLNPQPLPPRSPTDKGADNGEGTSAGGSQNDGSSSGTPTGPHQDAGIADGATEGGRDY